MLLESRWCRFAFALLLAGTTLALPGCDQTEPTAPARVRVGGTASSDHWYGVSDSGVYSVEGLLAKIEYSDDPTSLGVTVLVPEDVGGLTLWHDLPILVEGASVSLEGRAATWKEVFEAPWDDTETTASFVIADGRLRAHALDLRPATDLPALSEAASPFWPPSMRRVGAEAKPDSSDPYWLEITEAATARTFAYAHDLQTDEQTGQRVASLSIVDELGGAQIYQSIRVNVAPGVPTSEFSNGALREITVGLEGGTIVLSRLADAPSAVDENAWTREDTANVASRMLEPTAGLAIAALAAWVLSRGGKRVVRPSAMVGALLGATSLAAYWRLTGIMGFREALWMATLNFNPLVLIWIPYSAMYAYLRRSPEPRGWVFAAIGFGISLSLNIVFVALWPR